MNIPQTKKFNLIRVHEKKLFFFSKAYSITCKSIALIKSEQRDRNFCMENGNEFLVTGRLISSHSTIVEKKLFFFNVHIN